MQYIMSRTVRVFTGRLIPLLPRKLVARGLFTREVAVTSRTTTLSGRWGVSTREGSSTNSPRFAHCPAFLTSSPRHMATTARATVQTDHYQVTIEPTRKLLSLQLAGEEKTSFNSTWLRYNCQCSECKQYDTGALLYDPANMKPAYTLQTAEIVDDLVKLVWAEDSHCGSIPVSFLLEHDYSDKARHRNYLEKTPTVVQKNEVPRVTYQDVVKSEEGLYSWVQKLNEYGVCVIDGGPVEEGSVSSVTDLIWTIQPTLYGDIFDVFTKPTPINVAYSDVYLTYHMDTIYYESPPGAQFLHCIRFDDCVTGGESLLVDAWAVAEKIKTEYPDYFEVLTRVPATFQKVHAQRDRPVWMRFQRKHIETCPRGNITSVIWAPPFAAPLSVPEEDVDMYFKAYHQFAQEVEKSPSRLEFRLKEGDILTFNNRRMLHARKAFELNGGSRHLQGCYINIDEFQSRVEVLTRKYGAGHVVKRAFNKDFR